MEIQIPAPVEQIIEQLNRCGYEACAVGGCVRDSLLGRVPGDWDITTSAHPAQVKAAFRRTVDTGIAHGTVTVMIDKTGYEVTTYRIDGEYEDGRHPKEVEFTSDLIQDLKRRDFTINAMAYSHDTGIVDAFGGMEDLKAGIIRCVGNPTDRFTEDALRILRALRFSAQLGFEIERETYEAIKTMAPNLKQISRERIQMELTKLLLSPHPEKIQMVFNTGMALYISDAFGRVHLPLPAISPALPAKKHLRWAAFLQNETEGDAASVLKQLKSDNDTINRTKILVRFAKTSILPEKAAIRHIMSQMEPELYDDLLLLKETRQEALSQVRRLTEEIRREGDCLSLKSLAVGGQDLIDAGIRPGKAVGETLNCLLDLVLNHPEYNQKETLIQYALERKPEALQQ